MSETKDTTPTPTASVAAQLTALLDQIEALVPGYTQPDSVRARTVASNARFAQDLIVPTITAVTNYEPLRKRNLFDVDRGRRSLQIRDEETRFLGGESLGEALDRVLPAFDRLLAEDWETALAVFHGGVNRILLSHALAGGRAYFGTFEQAPACINVLDLGTDGHWIVRTVNYIPYDPLHPARTTTMEHLWAELKAWLDER